MLMRWAHSVLVLSVLMGVTQCGQRGRLKILGHTKDPVPASEEALPEAPKAPPITPADIKEQLEKKAQEARAGMDSVKAMLVTQVFQYKHSQKCLEVEAPAADDGARAQQYACNGSPLQKFRFVSKASGQWLQLVISGKCLTSKVGALDNGTPIVQARCEDSAAFRFQVIEDGEGYAFIKHEASGRCVDIEAISLNDKAGAQLWDCVNGEAQRVKITSKSP